MTELKRPLPGSKNPMWIRPLEVAGFDSTGDTWCSRRILAGCQGCRATTTSTIFDHLDSLDLGGSNDPKNLWSESYYTEQFNAHVKDKLEDRLAANVRTNWKGAVMTRRLRF